MYALVEDNNITKIINNPTSLVIGDVRYPAKIFSLWSKAELNAIGIYEVETNSTNFKDEKWYVNTNENFLFEDNKVTRTWGTATAKAHADTLYTNQDNTDGLIPDDKSVGDVKAEGLKTILIRDIKKGSILSPIDTAIPTLIGPIIRAVAALLIISDKHIVIIIIKAITKEAGNP